MFVSLISVSYITISSVIPLMIGKHSELYYAISWTFFVLVAALNYNLYGYFFTEFYSEAQYYFYYLGSPLIGIFVNLLLIFFLKSIKRINPDVDNLQFELFFLTTLNYHLLYAWIKAKGDILFMIDVLLSVSFNTLFMVYSFILILYYELYIWRRIRIMKPYRKWLLMTMGAYMVVLLIPVLFHFILIPHTPVGEYLSNLSLVNFFLVKVY